MPGTTPPNGLQVIDLESEDVFPLDTFAHGRVSDAQ